MEKTALLLGESEHNLNEAGGESPPLPRLHVCRIWCLIWILVKPNQCHLKAQIFRL